MSGFSFASVMTSLNFMEVSRARLLTFLVLGLVRYGLCLGGIAQNSGALHSPQARAAQPAADWLQSTPGRLKMMRRERKANGQTDGSADVATGSADAEGVVAAQASLSSQAAAALAVEAEVAALSRQDASSRSGSQLLEVSSSVIHDAAGVSDAGDSGGVNAARDEKPVAANSGSYASMPLGAEGLQGARGEKGLPGAPGKSRTYAVPGSVSEAMVANTVMLQIVLVLLVYCGVRRRVHAISAGKTAVNDMDAAKKLLASSEVTAASGAAVGATAVGAAAVGATAVGATDQASVLTASASGQRQSAQQETAGQPSQVGVGQAAGAAGEPSDAVYSGSGAASGAERRDTEPVAGEAAGPPPVLFLSGVGEYDGEYRLADLPAEKNQTGFPIWQRVGTADYIFSGKKGRWILGDEDEYDLDFITSTGNFATTKRHEGQKFPHEWTEGWLQYSRDQEQWNPCPDMKVTNTKT
eukprot:TRINITY_DN3144_c0_g2_i1.p1 TRINITY_DN3144_c0_g2~~TRINITY_DN3144_c0_g2_i1.p1  ORF type:complete len:469 (+),score=68.24 TRINITY_DN3144_c0_g2_i1:113-1519(+)